MNTKQLVIAWYAALVVAGLMFAADVDDPLGVLLQSVAILLVAGLLIYTFGQHNQANNRRVAVVVVGVPLALAVVIFGGAFLYEAFLTEDQDERKAEVLRRQAEAAYDAWGIPTDSASLAARNLNRARADSLELSKISGERASSGCPTELFRCLRVTGNLRNGAGVTATSVEISVVITDTLGNRVGSGVGQDAVRIAPGETGSFAAATSARPYLGVNRRLQVKVIYAEFLNE